MIVKENLAVGYKVLRPAVNVKTPCFTGLGSHYVVGMKILNIVVRFVSIRGGLMGQIPNKQIKLT